jgi:uncharacterized protein (DUF1501 family)
MNVSRRLFLKNGGVALASVGLVPALGPSFLQRAALAQMPGKKKKTLVCVFMRGAADGLSVVVPHGEAELYRARPNIAIPRNQVIDLDGFFGLHPALEPLAKLYKDGHLAAVHACGSPSSTRSHFDAMDYMESGTPGSKAVHDGWLARAALLCPEDRAKAKAGKSPFRAVALGGGLPTAMRARLPSPTCGRLGSTTPPQAALLLPVQWVPPVASRRSTTRRWAMYSMARARRASRH